MSQRDSGYERKERDCYETPEWVTLALVPHIGERKAIHEPACGSGKMVRALIKAGYNVTANDLDRGYDFLEDAEMYEAIVTNPPYAQAQSFIEHALESAPFVAMLLRTDFDHAKRRQHLFGGCRWFDKKVVLTQRIRWFEDSSGSPSFNHAWYIWNRRRSPIDRPQLVYH